MNNITKKMVAAILSRHEPNIIAATAEATKMMRGKVIVDLPEEKYNKLFQEKIEDFLILRERLRLVASRAKSPKLTRSDKRAILKNEQTKT